jgi:hypothetical protein
MRAQKVTRSLNVTSVGSPIGGSRAVETDCMYIHVCMHGWEPAWPNAIGYGDGQHTRPESLHDIVLEQVILAGSVNHQCMTDQA